MLNRHVIDLNPKQENSSVEYSAANMQSVWPKGWLLSSHRYAIDFRSVWNWISIGTDNAFVDANTHTKLKIAADITFFTSVLISCVVLCYLLVRPLQRLCQSLRECIFKCHVMTRTCRYRQNIFGGSLNVIKRCINEITWPTSCLQYF